MNKSIEHPDSYKVSNFRPIDENYLQQSAAYDNYEQKDYFNFNNSSFARVHRKPLPLALSTQHMDPHQTLISLISSQVTLSENDLKLCREYFEPVVLPKNFTAEEAGRIPSYLYYVNSGFMRLFYYNDQGDEITTHINCPPGFITSYQHFIHATTSNEFVECVTACDLLRITRGNLELLTTTSGAMKDFSIWVFQQSLQYNEARANQLATLTAEQRYRNLILHYPGIVQHVPLQYIASFLGIKPESLSRIRKQLN